MSSYGISTSGSAFYAIASFESRREVLEVQQLLCEEDWALKVEILHNVTGVTPAAFDLIIRVHHESDLYVYVGRALSGPLSRYTAWVNDRLVAFGDEPVVTVLYCVKEVKRREANRLAGQA